ncbi:MAG TPA: hypothetical protein VFS43_01205 [Polyangiaceae bacterium]|nr:hypothetical protein [Polyangiaceae bacterium]
MPPAHEAGAGRPHLLPSQGRALAHHEPHVLLDALRALVPDFLPPEQPVGPAEPAPTRLDALAPPRDADSVLRVGTRLLAHVECQGDRDTTVTPAPERAQPSA